MSDVEGIKKSVGEGYRKTIEEYDKTILAIPYNQGIEETVTYSTDELSAVCPVTGLPDNYTLHIEIIPHKLVPELKSLKMYLLSYRNTGILHEDLAPKILKDLINVVHPKYIKLSLLTATRGGVVTKVEVENGTKG